MKKEITEDKFGYTISTTSEHMNRYDELVTRIVVSALPLVFPKPIFAVIESWPTLFRWTAFDWGQSVSIHVPAGMYQWVILGTLDGPVLVSDEMKYYSTGDIVLHEMSVAYEIKMKHKQLPGHWSERP